MNQYDGVASAADAVRRFIIINEGALPEIVQQKVSALTGTGSSPVDLIVNFVEAIYANRDDVTNDAKAIAAGCADVIDRDNYHGRLDGRIVGMKAALRRDSGETAADDTPWPETDDDPAPNRLYAPQPAEQPAE
jgi:hypothetical protein